MTYIPFDKYKDMNTNMVGNYSIVGFDYRV